ncbi:MAG TPA: NUDIX domain-containing protein [Candidatus Babeliales bacterium]|nr:NUDIX domain-containing protein [Candidatus Babeliales bacterium]
MLIYTLGILEKNSNILFLLRQNTPFFSGYYGLIGGQVENNESITDALIREVYEEIGVTITKNAIHFAHSLSFKNEHDKAILALVFKITEWNGHISNKEPDKCAQLAWFSVNELPDNIIPRHRHIIIMVQQGILYSECGW